MLLGPLSSDEGTHPTKNALRLTLVSTAAVGALLTLSACSGDSGLSLSTGSDRTVRYEAAVDGPVDTVLRVTTEGTPAEDGISLSSNQEREERTDERDADGSQWSADYDLDGDEDASLTVQGRTGRTATCRIVVGDDVLVEQTASEPGAAATCSVPHEDLPERAS